MSAKPSPTPFPIAAAVPIATAEHITTGCTALETRLGMRVPAVKPKRVASSSDSWAAGLESFARSAPGACPDPPATASTPDTTALAPRPRTKGPRKTGAVGLRDAAESVVEASAGAERAPTTAAVDDRLTNQPPQTSSRSLRAFTEDGGGDSGRTTKLGAKNTGSHLAMRTGA